jgi:hypothetical protein
VDIELKELENEKELGFEEEEVCKLDIVREKKIQRERLKREREEG